MKRAALYSSASGLQRKDAAEVLEEYMARINWSNGDTVLDVGCGSGDVTASLLLPGLPHTCQRVLGVDVSHDMVQYAACTHQYPRLHFIQGDIAMEHLKRSELWREAGPGFHKIFSFFCLHWIQEQRRALRNIHALLRKHGEALLVFLASCPIYTMYEALAKKPEWKEYMQDVSRFVSPYQHSEDPAEEFATLLHDVGFTSVDCKIRESCHEFDSIDNLTGRILKGSEPVSGQSPIEPSRRLPDGQPV
ncbi:juvenile hormone acid O-methyltransferase isoform X2 [Anabrus simplex]|uniref:juvenile hormone acid O-methyltransferase isoform X2 n=1 Tax=Anabrus simplex TaxID=316456 RepID=UPI0035A347AF